MGKGQRYKKCESRKCKNKYVIEKLEKKKNRENGKDKQRATKQNNKE